MQVYITVQYNAILISIMGTAKRAATYRLSDEAHELLDELQEQMGLKETAVVELAIRDLARSRGISPKSERKPSKARS